MNVSQWKQLESYLEKWTSMQGQWMESLNASTRLIRYEDNEIKRPPHLITKVYDKCGSVHNRNDLDYWWYPPNSTADDVSVTFSWPNPTEVSLRNMCRILEGRTLVFMGDSLSQHTWETLVTSFGNRSNSSLYEMDVSNKNKDVSIFEEDYQHQCTEMNEMPFKTVYIKQPFLSHFINGIGTKNMHFIKKYLSKYDKEDENGAIVILNYGNRGEFRHHT